VHPDRLRVRAIRGAIDVAEDTPQAMRAAVTQLIGEIVSRNDLGMAEIVSAIFTSTPDLVSTFPALAAREAGGGWESVPLLGATEVGVPGALPRCIRVLVTVEISADQQVQHVYLGGAAKLRPDLHRDTSTAPA
jgi:chorismate mutase